MKEYKYLDNHKRAKCAAAILSLLTLALIVVILKGNSMSAALPVLTGLCTLAAVILACFVMHYINHNTENNLYRPMAALHAWAVHAILIIALLFAGAQNSFSYGVIHALLDGALAAALILFAGSLFGKRFALISILVGLAAAVLSLLMMNTVLNILLAVIGVICIVAAFMQQNSPVFLFVLALGATTAVMCVVGIVRTDFGLHKTLHLLVVMVGCLFFFAVSCIASLLAEKNPTRALNDSIENDDSDCSFDRDRWIIKKYQHLSPTELVAAPVDALYGVSEGDAELLRAAFGIVTVGDLADNKFFIWATEIVEEAEKNKVL